MKLITLNKEQIIEIYNERMVNDFPADELRPLAMITKPFDDGVYSCYALIDAMSDTNLILGYACFIRLDNHYLFDYLAIYDKKRGSGLGSTFLSLLAKNFKDSDSVIGEVEDPDYAESEDEKSIQERRLNFYLRNGYIDTGVRVKLFGVDYIVLELNLGKPHDKETISELYSSHYKSMLPAKLYETMVYIKQ